MSLEESHYEPFVDDFLEHYGVRGMKWGVRKRRDESARAKTFGKKGNPEATKINTKTKARELSDKELQAQIQRMQNERLYSKLTSQRAEASKSKGRKFLDKQLAGLKEAGKDLAGQVASAAASKLGEMLVEAMFNAATGAAKNRYGSGAKDYATATIDRQAIATTSRVLTTGRKMLTQ